MTVYSAEEFRNHLLEQLEMKIINQESHHIYYANEQNGWFHLYYKKGYYELTYADYHIPHDFMVNFSNNSRMIRFGTVSEGNTTYMLKGQEIASSFPSSFLVLEDHQTGSQLWKAGQHFHGIEIALYEDYIRDVMQRYADRDWDSSTFPVNQTYHHLPLQLTEILQDLNVLCEDGRLSRLYLEAKMIESIAAFDSEICSLDDKQTNVFSDIQSLAFVPIGNRIVRLSDEDLQKIQHAHQILSENFINAPTITALSNMVLLNEQKLKAGFHAIYHMTMREYSNSLLMETACRMLCTTSLRVEIISQKLGYGNPSNFIKAFRETYQITPGKYRINKKRL